jgi:2-methylcitrate dehydratase PrpD
MDKTIVEQLADFTLASGYEILPDQVVDECKRLLLDSVGCALAATDQPKGRIGIGYGRMLGGSGGEATIIGTGDRVSVFGAAFANGELINALDFDSVLPPGHVSPYVLPAALAIAESRGTPGKDVISAIAVAHEMSYRIGKAMDYVRDVKDGKVSPPAVAGYSSTVFGATAAVMRLNRDPSDVLASGLGIAGAISPVNAHRAWTMHSPSSTIKYLLAGTLAQTAMTAAHMAELGHRGDVQILDDADFGYRRFIGTSRWQPERITDGLGEQWLFPPDVSYKPYPHCRIMHALIDGLTEIVEENDLKPEEIESINSWGEGWVEQPVWLNRDIRDVHDAQFSMAHGLALAAHRVPPGKAWQDPELVFNPSVLGLMDRTTTAVHPDYADLISANSASRPSRIEVVARGRSFVAEHSFPKGTPSTDPTTRMTTDELIAKFRHNAEDVIVGDDVDALVDEILSLEAVRDFSALMRRLGNVQSSAPARAGSHVGVA